MEEIKEQSHKQMFINNKENDEIEIDLKEIFYFLLAKWKIIVVFVILGTLIFAGYHKFLLQPTYKADASIYITNTDSLLTFSDLQLSSALTEDYAQIIKSRTVLKEVISDLNLDIDYKQLNQLITVEIPSSSHIVHIYVSCDDPTICRDIANSLMTISVKQIYKIIGSGEPTIIDRAELDAVQNVTPSLVKYLCIGAGMGFILIMVILVVQIIIDGSIKNEKDIEQYLDIPVLTVVPYYETSKNK